MSRDPQTVMGDKAIGLLRQIHESGQLSSQSKLATEVANLLGQPGDPEYRRIEKSTRDWMKDPYGAGYGVLRTAVLRHADLLKHNANAIGAGSAAQKALSDLKALAEQVENL